jgi:translocation and assembly module TamA
MLFKKRPTHCYRIAKTFLVTLFLSLNLEAAIKVEGLESDLTDAIISQSPLNDAACDAPVWWLEKQVETTLELTLQLLETQGYYRPSIQHVLTMDDCWHVTFSISKGVPTKIRSLDLQGLDGLFDKNLPTSLKQGEHFFHRDYETFKSNLVDFARSQGYLDAAWDTNKITIILPDTATDDTQVFADIELNFNAGEQYVLGEINHNLGHINKDFVDKFHDLKRGQPFARDALDKAYRHLNATGYFSSLNMLPDYENITQHEVPVTIDGTLSRRRIYEIGAGYATDSGPRTRGEINWRRINTRGDRARLAAVQATHNAEFSLEYRRADADDPRNRWTSYISAYEYDQPDTYRREKTSVTGNQYQRTELGWTKSNVIQYSNEIWRIGNTLGDTRLLSIGQGYQRNQVEGKGRLHSGTTYSGSWRAASQSIGSDIDVIQMQLASKKIVPFAENWRLLLRGKLGFNLLDDINLLPPDLRFYAGGDNSIRGYDLDTIGETTNIDNKMIVIGGKRLIEGSLEVDYPFLSNWSAALFVDTGSAFNDKPDLHTGVGFGFRWYSPLGPVKFDVARGLDGINPGWRLHISFGAEL